MPRLGRGHVTQRQLFIGGGVLFPSRKPEKRILVGSELLVPLAAGQGVIDFEMFPIMDFADFTGLAEILAAGNFQIAGNGPENGPAPWRTGWN